MRLKALLAPALVLLALGLAACGGDDETSSDTEATTTAIPRSGCLISIARIARHSAIDTAFPGNPDFSFCFANSQAASTAKLGLTNSEGCSDKPGTLIQRLAPLISIPITNVIASSTN